VPATSVVQLKVADEVWVATALLHRKHPQQTDFAIEEIMRQATKHAGKRPLRPGVYVHIVLHCVANRPAKPARYRMLIETAPGRRRLFQTGDRYHPEREGAKTDLKAARKYAAIRGSTSIKGPDAIQFACASEAGVDLFVTNDRRLQGNQVEGIQFIVSLDQVPF
jgi:hypothetical protein